MALYPTPVLNPSNTVTTTTTQAAQNVGPGLRRKPCKGAYITCSAIAGAAPSVVVTVQTSPDGTNWATCCTFTAITAAPAFERKVMTFSPAFTDVDQYMRTVATFGGTTTSFTYEVTLMTDVV